MTLRGAPTHNNGSTVEATTGFDGGAEVGAPFCKHSCLGKPVRGVARGREGASIR